MKMFAYPYLPEVGRNYYTVLLFQKKLLLFSFNSLCSLQSVNYFPIANLVADRSTISQFYLILVVAALPPVAIRSRISSSLFDHKKTNYKLNLNVFHHKHNYTEFGILFKMFFIASYLQNMSHLQVYHVHAIPL